MTADIVELGRFPVDIVIGRNVRLHRLARKLGVEAVAHQLCLSTDEYSRAEAGKRRFTAYNLMSLCDLLDIKSEHLMAGLIHSRDSTASPKLNKQQVEAEARSYISSIADTASTTDVITLAFLCRRMFNPEA